MSKTVKVGLIGAGFVTDLHVFSFQKYVPNAEVVAVASPTPGKAAHFAKARNIPHTFDNYRDLLALKDIDVVTVAIPNDLHAQVTLDAARAGKHVICEKPLCKTLEEADQMIDECRKHGVLLLYAEELLFAPKYARAKTLVDEGAVGKVFLAKQAEEHSGPHMPWGCHAIGRRRAAGHGLPLDRVYALGVGQAQSQERLGDAGHVRARRQNAGRGSFGDRD
jgi:myo-inositol 2-dehydrogenase/D-chiro-inositol 1-dehydrogenase